MTYFKVVQAMGAPGLDLINEQKSASENLIRFYFNGKKELKLILLWPGDIGSTVS